ncbi:HNH endonuclease [Chloroflexota bacterium]
MPSYECPYCWKTGNRRTKHDDHIIPKKRGGCDCRENKVYACNYCNNQKSTKTPLEYFSWLNSIGHFDYWKYTKSDRKNLLAQLAELEIRAVEHMKGIHGISPSWWD